MSTPEKNLTQPVAFKGRRLASHGLRLAGSSIWAEIIKRVDAGEGFKPVVKSMGIKPTSARKYALILYREWYLSIAAIQHQKSGKTLTGKKQLRLMHVPDIAFIRWFVKVCKRVARLRDGRLRSLRAARRARVFRTPEEKEVLRVHNNAIALARYKFNYANDEEFRKRVKEKVILHKKLNPEMNRKHARKAQKKWRLLNPDAARMKHRIHAQSRRHKARAQKMDGDALIRKAIEKCKHVCYWCGCKLIKNEWHMDHVMPLSKGGAHAAFNLVKACKACNESKSDKMPSEFVTNGQMVML